jgi:hypothetical protein
MPVPLSCSDSKLRKMKQLDSPLNSETVLSWSKMLEVGTSCGFHYTFMGHARPQAGNAVQNWPDAVSQFTTSSKIRGIRLDGSLLTAERTKLGPLLPEAAG